MAEMSCGVLLVSTVELQCFYPTHYYTQIRTYQVWIHAPAERRSESVKRQDECCTAANVYIALLLAILFLLLFGFCCVPFVLVNGLLQPSRPAIEHRAKISERRSQYLKWRADGANDDDSVNLEQLGQHKASLFFRPPYSSDFDFGRGKSLFGQFTWRIYVLFRFIYSPIVIYCTNLVRN